MDLRLPGVAALLLSAASSPLLATGLDVQADLAFSASDTANSWTHAGLDKGPRNGTRAFGSVLASAKFDLSETIVAQAILQLDPERSSPLGVQEAWIAWKPFPGGPWRQRLRVGAMLPDFSLEPSHEEIGWTPHRTVSQSAINSWLSEEVRPFGVEWTWQRRGASAGSPHDISLTAAAIGGNDPDGTLIAWRGWSIGSRVTDIGESIRLPDLPVYRQNGPIAAQSRRLTATREVDGRPGYYAVARYAWRERLDVSVAHFDSRGDPLQVQGGQYSWRTRFDHLGVTWHAPAGWDFIAQGMTGTTLMGPSAVNVTFSGAYGMLSHAVAAGLMTLRYDRFGTRGHDALPQDPNDETGSGWALAYRRPLGDAFTLITEALRVSSHREARRQIAEAPDRIENSLTVLLRWSP
jgi:hypothetical protein